MAGLHAWCEDKQSGGDIQSHICVIHTDGSAEIEFFGLLQAIICISMLLEPPDQISAYQITVL